MAVVAGHATSLALLAVDIGVVGRPHSVAPISECLCSCSANTEHPLHFSVPQCRSCTHCNIFDLIEEGITIHMPFNKTPTNTDNSSLKCWYSFVKFTTPRIHTHETSHIRTLAPMSHSEFVHCFFLLLSRSVKHMPLATTLHHVPGEAPHRVFRLAFEAFASKASLKTRYKNTCHIDTQARTLFFR